MLIRLNQRFLDDRFDGIITLQIPPSRVAFVPKDSGDSKEGERGLPEYILAYRRALPNHETEPELFRLPHEEKIKQGAVFGTAPVEFMPSELWLQYKDATVILIAQDSDDKFRRENPDLINKIEALYVGPA